MIERKSIDYLICAAGDGFRLKDTIQHLPKPLIKMNGETLLERSLSSLDLYEGDRLIVITQKAHAIKAKSASSIRKKFPHVKIEWLELDELTSGQLETAVAARELLRPQHPVVIFNSDTYFRPKPNFKLDQENFDGIIPSSEEDGDAWSFCEVNEDGYVTRVTEKVRISNLASVGYYYFGSSEVFLFAADQELSEAREASRESYVAPIYNRLISNGLRVVAPKVDSFLPMGTLEQMANYWDVDAESLKSQNEPHLKAQTAGSTFPFSAGLFGFVASLILFSPGFMDPDTTWQFNQATQNFYYNWHPPLVAYLWHFLLYVVPGSWGPFLVENAAFWLGLTLVTRHMLPALNRIAAAVILLLGLCPSMFTPNALVWKDAMMGSMLLLAVGLILQLEKSKRPFLFLVPILMLLFFVTGTRYNALAATIPLFIWMGGFLPGKGWRVREAIGIGLSLAVIFLNGNIAANIFLTDHEDSPQQVLTTFDLGGMSVFANKNLFPEIYPTNLEDIRAAYRPNSVMPLLWSWPPGTENLNHPGFIGERHFPEAREAWLKSIFRYPTAYLQHRLAFFRSFLGMRRSWDNGGLYLTDDFLPQDPSPFRVDGLTQLSLLLLRHMEFGSYLFRPYVYLLLLPLTFFFYRRRKKLFLKMNEQWEFFFGLSGLLYLFSYFIVGVASDYRYIWWTVIVTTILSARFVFVKCETFIQNRVRQYRQPIQ